MIMRSLNATVSPHHLAGQEGQTEVRACTAAAWTPSCQLTLPGEAKRYVGTPVPSFSRLPYSSRPERPGRLAVLLRSARRQVLIGDAAFSASLRLNAAGSMSMRKTGRQHTRVTLDRVRHWEDGWCQRPGQCQAGSSRMP